MPFHFQTLPVKNAFFQKGPPPHASFALSLDRPGFSPWHEGKYFSRILGSLIEPPERNFIIHF